jgi:restriction system protein
MSDLARTSDAGSASDAVVLPAYTSLLWPTVVAMRELGGSGSIDEIVETVVRHQGFTEQLQSVPHGDGSMSEIEYRLAWARTYLKGMGLLINSSRGVWSLTDEGRTVAESEISGRHSKYVADLRDSRRRRKAAGQVRDSDARDPEPGDSDDSAWRDRLLDALLAMTSGAFERLMQRLLREAGFTSTTVTDRSGDGGIDGVGVYRMSLISFPVFFQCKRYRGSVGAGAVRDFRGAMAGRGDKGLLITTGTFTGEAKAEATRDGAPPVDLIDGQRLCELLKTYDLGVVTTVRQVEDVRIDAEFFASI